VVVRIKARCICPIHGRLSFDDIIIRNGVPVCRKCYSELQFGVVKPRRLDNNGKKVHR